MRGIEQIPWLYDALSALADEAGLRDWRHWLTRDAAGLTLELGCGTGRNLPYYGPEARVVGLERDPGVLRKARIRGPDTPIVQGRAEALPFRDSAFARVVSGLVFCSVDDPQAALREVRRVLESDGELRMMEHVRSTNRVRAWLQDVVQPAWTWVTGGCRPNRDTEARVQAAGFEIDRDTRRAEGMMRLFTAVPRGSSPQSPVQQDR